MEESEKPPIEIPVSALSPEALSGIIEAFILREGTDYGAVEMSFEKKVVNLKKQLERGEIHLVFDPNTESVTFLTSAQFMA